MNFSGEEPMVNDEDQLQEAERGSLSKMTASVGVVSLLVRLWLRNLNSATDSSGGAQLKINNSDFSFSAHVSVYVLSPAGLLAGQATL